MGKPTPEEAVLIIRAPNGDVREVTITELAIVIGRDESADVRVDDKKVSRRHAGFKMIDGRPYVEDFGSVNGVKINGKRINRRAEIGPKDVVRVGGYEVRLKVSSSPPTGEPSRTASRAIRAGEEVDARDKTRGLVKDYKGPIDVGHSTAGLDPEELSRVRERSQLRSAGASSFKIILIGQDPPVEGKRFSLGLGEHVVGRLEDTSVAILDGSVSRQHARVVVDVDRVTLADLGSANGTFVDGERIEIVDIRPGDKIKFGSVRFELEIPDRTASARVRREEPKDATALKPIKEKEGKEPIAEATARTSPEERSRRSPVLLVLAIGVLAALAATAFFVRARAGSAGWPPTFERTSSFPYFVARRSGPSADAGSAADASPGAAVIAVKTNDAGASRVVARTEEADAGRAVAEARADAGARVVEVTKADAASVARVEPPPAAPRAREPDAGLTGAVAKAPPGASGPPAPSGARGASGLDTPPPPPTSTIAGALPRDLPKVDPSFDFDGFVAAKLKAAEAGEKGGAYPEVRKILGELLDRDPINQDARLMLKRITVIETSSVALFEGDAFAAKGELLEAYERYTSVPSDAPQAKEAKKRAEAIRPRLVQDELTRALDEMKSPKTWAQAHDRLRGILEIDWRSERARDAIRALERQMRTKDMRFASYVPPREDPPAEERPGGPASGPGVAQTGSAKDLVLRELGGDKGLFKIAEAYLDGDMNEALKRADAVAKKANGPKKAKAKAMSAAITKIKGKYQRARTEISNDPAAAWAQLIELGKIEESFLPIGVPTYLRSELEQSIAEAFAARGAALFEQSRFEDAFQQWDSGFKLNAMNPKILAGLKKLEERAKKEAGEAELAAQRGEKDVCARWKKITRMTRADSEIHKRARERARSCG